MGPRRLIGPLVRAVSPQHRRWAAILQSCDLDLDQLPDPLPAVGPDDVIICGSPRTGTSLASAMLWQPPNCVTVMEPWDGLRMPARELFASLRDEMASTGTLGRGRLDVPALEREGTTTWVRDGDCVGPVDYAPDSLVAVKYPGFWRYVGRLPGARFVVCLRDPVATIRSFRTTGGRLAEGLQYEVAFEESLNERLRAEFATNAERRVGLYDAINDALIPHLDRPDVFVLRFERWATDRDALLGELGAFLGRDLSGARAEVRPPKPPPEDEEAQFIRARCRTGALLGYA